MSELMLGSLGLWCIGRGVWLAMRRAPQASSWMVVGAGFTLALASTIPPTLGATSLFFLGVTGVPAAGVLLIAAQLRKDCLAAIDAADDAQVRRFFHEARTQRRSRRLRGRPGVRLTWPSPTR